jgi:hypothetical protein
LRPVRRWLFQIAPPIGRQPVEHDADVGVEALELFGQCSVDTTKRSTVDSERRSDFTMSFGITPWNGS